METLITLPLASEEETMALGASLAPILRPGDVVALRGDLGAGKTALARGAVQSVLGPDTETPSPTFTLVQTYDFPVGELWHCDLYRLEQPDDALELGLEDAFADAICLIEWPDRLGPYLPDDRLDLALTITGDAAAEARSAELRGGPAWRARLQAVGLLHV